MGHDRDGIRPGHPEWEGHSIAELADRFDQAPPEAAKAIVDAEGYGAVVVMHSMQEDDVRTVMAHPSTMIGSDGIPTVAGKPHPRLYGTFAKVLGHCDERVALARTSRAPHDRYAGPSSGLADRGSIRAGAEADLVLFDPATINDVATTRIRAGTRPGSEPSG